MDRLGPEDGPFPTGSGGGPSKNDPLTRGRRVLGSGVCFPSDDNLPAPSGHTSGPGTFSYTWRRPPGEGSVWTPCVVYSRRRILTIRILSFRIKRGHYQSPHNRVSSDPGTTLRGGLDPKREDEDTTVVQELKLAGIKCT